MAAARVRRRADARAAGEGVPPGLVAAPRLTKHRPPDIFVPGLVRAVPGKRVATVNRMRTAGAKRTGMAMPVVAFRVMVGVNMLLSGWVGAERAIVLGLATMCEIRPTVPSRE